MKKDKLLELAGYITLIVFLGALAWSFTFEEPARVEYGQQIQE